MQDTPSKPPAVKGRKSLVGILRVVLALSLLALAVSVPRLFKKSSPEPTPQAAVEPTAPEPTTDPPRVRSKAWLAAHKTDRFARAPARDADRAALIGASNLWASVASPTRSGYLIAARLPELRAGIDGVLARFEPPIFYRVPAQYSDELRADFGQIAGATNLLKQFEAEVSTLQGSLERDRQNFLSLAKSADAQGKDESSAALKQLLDLKALYLDRKREFEKESAALMPQLQDPPAIFERKLPLYQAAANRYAKDVGEIENAIYTIEQQIYAASQALRANSSDIDTAFERSAQEAIGRFNVLSNRLHQQLGEVNGWIHEYNTKLGRFGMPLEPSR